MNSNRWNTQLEARGKWQGILLALGVAPELLNKKRHQPCPFCGGKDRFRWTDHKFNGGYLCNVCGAGTGMKF